MQIKNLPELKRPRPAPTLDEAIEQFRVAWAAQPAASRVESLLPIIDMVVQVREQFVTQIAKLRSTQTPQYVPFMVGQYTHGAVVYEAFLTFVVALAESADAEARGEASGDAGERH